MDGGAFELSGQFSASNCRHVVTPNEDRMISPFSDITNESLPYRVLYFCYVFLL